MADITKKQITKYMKTLDTGTANGKVVMNQLKKAISMNESADTSFVDSINKKLQAIIIKTLASPMPKLKTPTGKGKGPFGDAPPAPMPDLKKQKKQMGGKVYSNTQSRKVRI
jgi:hypothetical protein